MIKLLSFTMLVASLLIFRVADCVDKKCVNSGSTGQNGVYVVRVQQNDEVEQTLFPAKVESCSPEVYLDDAGAIDWLKCVTCSNGEDVRDAVIISKGETIYSLFSSKEVRPLQGYDEFEECRITIKKDRSVEVKEGASSEAYVEGRLLVRTCDKFVVAGEVELFEPTKKELATADVLGRKPSAKANIKWARIY